MTKLKADIFNLSDTVKHNLNPSYIKNGGSATCRYDNQTIYFIDFFIFIKTYHRLHLYLLISTCKLTVFSLTLGTDHLISRGEAGIFSHDKLFFSLFLHNKLFFSKVSCNKFFFEKITH